MFLSGNQVTRLVNRMEVLSEESHPLWQWDTCVRLGTSAGPIISCTSAACCYLPSCVYAGGVNSPLAENRTFIRNQRWFCLPSFHDCHFVCVLAPARGTCGRRKVVTGIAGRIFDWQSCPNQLFIRSVVWKVSIVSDCVTCELLTK